MCPSLWEVPVSEAIKVLEGQIRECFGRVVYTHKTHEKCADILLSRHGYIKGVQILVSALVTSGIVATVFVDEAIVAVGSALFSAGLLAVNTYTKDHDLGAIAQKHRQAAAELWSVREEYLSLLTDIRAGDQSLQLIRERRDGLLRELQSVYSGAPSTMYAAYRKAQIALKELEDMTFSDAEIDAFLPRELKRGGT